MLDGRAPDGADEVALGRGSLDLLGKEIGDTVELEGPERSVPATIVGEIVAPAVIATPMDLDSGGVASMELTSMLFGDDSYAVSHLVDLQGDRDVEAAREHFEPTFPRTVLGPMRPLDVSALHRVRGIPFVIAGLLGTVALVSVAVTLATATRRRRREVAVLRSLGLDGGQVRWLLAGESTTFVLAALVVGVPVGVVLGRQAWVLAADGLGSEVGPTIPVLAIALGVLAVLAAVNLFGQWLAWGAARRHPGRDLRTE